MIVRNEAAVIERCLRSVKPYLASWVISDTGSTDGTPEIVQSYLAGIPGEVTHDVWIDFSHNRNLALQRAKGTADYLLLIDADMVLNADDDFRCRLVHDAYFVPFVGECDYSVVRLVNAAHEWEYRGVVHEAISSKTVTDIARLPGVSITHFEDGSARMDKFQREIRVLSESLEKDPNNARTVFYLAQSYRDIGKPQQAMELYQKRVEMVGWEEETWYALYQLGRMQEMIGGDFRVACFTYLQAWQVRPWRLEPIFPIVRFYNEHKQYHLAAHFARLVTEVGYPSDLLFIERPVYEYLLPYEYVISCWHTGREEEARRVMEILEGAGKIPADLLVGLKQLGNPAGKKERKGAKTQSPDFVSR